MRQHVHMKFALSLVCILSLLLGVSIHSPAAASPFIQGGGGYWEYVETYTNYSQPAAGETKVADFGETSIALLYHAPPGAMDQNDYRAQCSWQLQFENDRARLYPGQKITASLTVASTAGDQTAHGYINTDAPRTSSSGDAGTGIVPLIQVGTGQSLSDSGEYVVVPGPIVDWWGGEMAIEVTCGCFNISANVQYIYRWVPATPTPEATNTPASTDTPTPSATPEMSFTLSGRVYAPPDMMSWSPQDTPIPEVLIELTKNGAVAARTITRLPDGAYSMTVPGIGDYALEVTLEHAGTRPPAFQINYDQDPVPVKLQTAPFTVDGNAPAEIVKDVILAGDQGHSVIQGTAPVERLADLGLIYAYTRQAWEAGVRNGVMTDLALPYEVYAFSSLPDAARVGAYADVPNFGGNPYYGAAIVLSPDNSASGSKLAARTIWHEYGHCVQADLENDLTPYDGIGAWHDGYRNATTTSSWAEGFATFYGLLVNRDVVQVRRPLVNIYGWVISFEFPSFMPWTFEGTTSMEEYAVVSLLWDLVDDVMNFTDLVVSEEYVNSLGITVTQALDTGKGPAAYVDYVQMSTPELLKLIGEPAGVDQAPGGHTHINDIRQLYSVLKARGIGSEVSDHKGLDRLDELFIAHGFFADTAPGNFYYDQGEEIGYSANLALTVYAGTEWEIKIPERTNPLRRIPPPPPDAYLAYDAVDRRGDSAYVDTFEVEVKMDKPYEEYSYTFQAQALDPGKLLVMLPDPLFPATVEIKAVNSDGASEPLTLTSEEYWTALKTASDGVFMTHTFELKRGTPNADRSVRAVIGIAGGCVLLAAVLVIILLIVGRRMRLKRQAAKAAYQAPAVPANTPALPEQSTAQTPAPDQPARASHRPAEEAQSRMPEAATDEVICSACGARNPSGQRFCSTCGSPLAALTPKPAAAVCPACGHENRAGARFCAKCGRRMG